MHQRERTERRHETTSVETGLKDTAASVGAKSSPPQFQYTTLTEGESVAYEELHH